MRITFSRLTSCAVVLFIVSLSACAIASEVTLRSHLLVCGDILSASGVVDVRTSIGPWLPIPVIQSCDNAVPLISILIISCLVASTAWLALLRRPPSEATTIVLFTIAAGLAIAFPYFSTTDAYAYALYGYEAGILHISPYYQHVFPAHSNSPITATLRALFPTQNSVRVANYGVVFIMIYGALAFATNGSLVASLICMRILSAASLFLLAMIISRLVPLEYRRRTLVFVLLQPLVLFEAIAFAHADVLMLVMCTLGVAAYALNAVSLSAALFALGSAIRSIAALAAFTLVMYMLKSLQYHKLSRFIAASAVSFGVLITGSILVYHTFTLGSGPGINPYSSPSMLIATATHHLTNDAKPYAIAQALAALVCLANAVLRGKYPWASVWILAALPTLHPWYTCWLLPVAALTNDLRFRAVAVTIMVVAIFGEYSLISRHVSIEAARLYVCAQWILPAIVYMLGSFSKDGPLRQPAVA